MSTSFGKKLVNLQVTTKMSKLVDNPCLWQKKLNFHFFHVPIFGYCLTLFSVLVLRYLRVPLPPLYPNKYAQVSLENEIFGMIIHKVCVANWMSLFWNCHRFTENHTHVHRTVPPLWSKWSKSPPNKVDFQQRLEKKNTWFPCDSESNQKFGLFMFGTKGTHLYSAWTKHRGIVALRPLYTKTCCFALTNVCCFFNAHWKRIPVVFPALYFVPCEKAMCIDQSTKHNAGVPLQTFAGCSRLNADPSFHSNRTVWRPNNSHQPRTGIRPELSGWIATFQSSTFLFS